MLNSILYKMKVKFLIFFVLLSSTLIFAEDGDAMAYKDITEIIFESTESNDANRIKDVPDIIGSRIMGGEQVENINDFCYQVGIEIQVNGSLAWCGGIVISHDAILTAAHCLTSQNHVLEKGRLFFGVIDRDHPEPGSLIVDIDKSDWVMHEGWDDEQKTNDIGIIKLRQPLIFSDRICSISLVSKDDARKLYHNEQVLISGWGRSNDRVDNYEPKLKYAYVEVMDLRECNRILWQVKGSNICVKTQNWVAACKGDSGGPMVYSPDGSYSRNSRIVIGITSFTKRGCVQDGPRVYTKIGSYLNWICTNARVCNVPDIIFPDD